MGKINYYADSVQIEQNGQRDFDIVCKAMWPNLVRMEDIRGKDPQYHGIDRIVHLPGNITVTIQAKIRNTTFEDILLEYISNDKTKSSGWMELPSLAQWLLYLIVPNKTCYYFPWRSLQNLWNDNKHNWVKFGKLRLYGFSRIEARNKRYNTISVTVPAKVLLSNIKNSGVLKYG